MTLACALSPPLTPHRPRPPPSPPALTAGDPVAAGGHCSASRILLRSSAPPQPLPVLALTNGSRSGAELRGAEHPRSGAGERGSAVGAYSAVGGGDSWGGFGIGGPVFQGHDYGGDASHSAPSPATAQGPGGADRLLRIPGLEIDAAENRWRCSPPCTRNQAGDIGVDESSGGIIIGSFRCAHSGSQEQSYGAERDGGAIRRPASAD